MTEPNPTVDGRTVTVRVPISIQRRGGRKLVLAPDGANVTASPVFRHIDNAIIKALARAFRWREMLEDGTYATIREIAAAEKINESYVGRVLRLTLLAPRIVEAIIDGTQPPEVTLPVLMQPLPGAWNEQAYLNSRDAALTSRVTYSSRGATGAWSGHGLGDPDTDRKSSSSGTTETCLVPIGHSGNPGRTPRPPKAVIYGPKGSRAGRVV